MTEVILADHLPLEGLDGLADRSSRPRSSPRQTAPEVEALICELRRAHPLEYNTNRPHQSLDMAFPVQRFTPRPADERLPLRLPSTLASAIPVTASEPVPTAPVDRDILPAPLVMSANGVDSVNLAVEVTRVVPASGNLTVCGQQFWLGPDRAGTPVTLWADATVVHLICNGVRLKTMPSPLTARHLRGLLADGGRPPARHPSPPATLRRAPRSRWTGRSTPPA